MADIYQNQRVVLKSRPVTGHGETVRLRRDGAWRVKLDDGGVVWCDEGELLPEDWKTLSDN